MPTKYFFIEPTLSHLCSFLTRNKYNYYPCCFYNFQRIIVKQDSKNNKISLRMYESYSILNIWFEKYSSNRFICALDYTEHPEHIKIDYLYVNNEDGVVCYENKLTREESDEVMDALVKHVEIKAKETLKPKIILDVHENLRLYEKYFQTRGFMTTNRKSRDNSYWIETEKIV